MVRHARTRRRSRQSASVASKVVALAVVVVFLILLVNVILPAAGQQLAQSAHDQLIGSPAASYAP